MFNSLGAEATAGAPSLSLEPHTPTQPTRKLERFIQPYLLHGIRQNFPYTPF